jgi:4-diphosphocytidyl-2-C-methyl-D-erythritol kinase
VKELAYAKVNLCLYLGPLRSTDGRHELVSVMQSLDLADGLQLSDHPQGGGDDEVRCPGVDGPNLAGAAILAFRELTGWDGPRQLLAIDKRIPITGGMGGGSADAAAALRLLARRSGLGSDTQLFEIAATLGADVPSQVRPGRVLAEGAGERVSVLADPPSLGVLVLPSTAGLSTAAVYGEADRLGLARSASELAQILASLNTIDVDPVNDLEPAARALDPTIDVRLEQAHGAGATHAMVTGSGPTVIGLFATLQGARDGARKLREQGVDAKASSPALRHNSTRP